MSEFSDTLKMLRYKLKTSAEDGKFQANTPAPDLKVRKMIEYFPEPPEEKADSHCSHCGKSLFVGDTIADDKGEHICEDCMTPWALRWAHRSDFLEFITSSNLEDQFAKWFYGDNVKTLTVKEMEDTYE